jgi:para-aminobenzoate synthetase component 1
MKNQSGANEAKSATFEWLVSDFYTSQSAIDMFERFHLEPNSIFLDSGMLSNELARYSFIARDPFLTFTCKERKVILKSVEKTEVKEDADPFALLKDLLAQYKIPRHPNLPPLLSGIIGYFGYDLGYILEKLPDHSVDDLQVSDCQFGFYDTVIIVDHLLGKILVASTGFPEKDPQLRRARAQARIEEHISLLSSPFTTQPIAAPPSRQGNFTSNFSKEKYCEAVQKAIDYIYAGDIFQMNMTQRFQGPLYEPPFSLYRRLRGINPAPCASYLHFPDVIIASSSPERYLLVKGKSIETRPIKGTRPRGKDMESDAALRNELCNSLKDRAELVMIVDLERNDFGRVCKFGSVKVPEIIRIEEYPTVFHLVSTVVGELEEDKDVIDLVKASFPGGSITGAPKVRAMEIIDELEPQRRSIYTGSIGYIDFSGDADLNIVIRTFIIKNNIAYFNAGGGIVADSKPILEYEETLHKARALLKALGHEINI